jgi:hypothetical protein
MEGNLVLVVLILVILIQVVLILVVLGKGGILSLGDSKEAVGSHPKKDNCFEQEDNCYEQEAIVLRIPSKQVAITAIANINWQEVDSIVREEPGMVGSCPFLKSSHPSPSLYSF